MSLHDTHPPMMPRRAPLEMPDQRLDRLPEVLHDGRPHLPLRVVLSRIFVFGAALGLTGFLAVAFNDWFDASTAMAVRISMLALVVFTFFWIALSVFTALLGLFSRARNVAPGGTPLSVALLMPVYGEPVNEVYGRLRGMLEGLRHAATDHRFTLFVLSDTRSHALTLDEIAATGQLRATFPEFDIHYRHRTQNADFKSGNIRDWVCNWGADHDAMIVLDADSVMTAEALTGLADEMASDPNAGLIQTIPRLIHGRSVFARLQQFSTEVTGRGLGRGLALISGAEANFWGHNAIIHTGAFAAAAGLPKLGGRVLGGVILSHDFVEAALIRRAGWHVRFVPGIEGSFEQSPETVRSYILRDRRWCRGNLQHLRLLGTRGFAGMSRFHMAQGAMAYLTSLGWCAMLAIWSLFGLGDGSGVILYFNAAAPIFPDWPEMALVSQLTILGLVYAMLLAPKLMGACRAIWQDPSLSGFGGPLVFAVSLVLEIAVSVVLAPAMMVQHIKAIALALFDGQGRWSPKAETVEGWRSTLRFHGVETVLGLLLMAGCAFGAVSLWILPIAASLALSAPLVRTLGLPMSGPFLTTPQEMFAPRESRASAPDAQVLPV